MQRWAHKVFAADTTTAAELLKQAHAIDGIAGYSLTANQVLAGSWHITYVLACHKAFHTWVVLAE